MSKDDSDKPKPRPRPLETETVMKHGDRSADGREFSKKDSESRPSKKPQRKPRSK